jgi:nitroreductase
MLVAAALAILVCGDQDQAFERDLSFLLQDCSAATQNLLLAAHGLGLGACWVGVHPSEGAIQRLKRIFNLPSQLVPVAVVSVGWPGEELPARSRFNPHHVHEEKW